MTEKTQIKKAYFNLSYNFIYDSLMVNNDLSDLKYPNLLNYADRLFEKNRIKYYKNIKGHNLYLSTGKKGHKPYKLKIKDIYILFFENEMAFLNIKLEILDTHLSDLYSINKMLTNFYMKANESYVLVGDNNGYLDDAECEFYSPHAKNKPNRAYPFKQEENNLGIKEFKGRIGPTKNELAWIRRQNKFKIKSINRHYLYFEKQQEISKNQRTINDFIHYDTFITSLIMKYVKPNKSFIFFDNFNPIATNYINSYITLVCDTTYYENCLEDEYNNNFLAIEPLLSSKIKIGNKIIKPDFFKIYQSQADILTVGNSQNIVHILDSNSKNMDHRKYNDHFYTYQLTLFQKNCILKIINSSILNINNLKKENLLDINFNKFLRITKSYFIMVDAIKEYTRFLTNTNFITISNSSSIDNSYKFFRDCNEVDKLINQWSRVSSKLKDTKSVLMYVVGYPATIIAGAILFYNFYPSILNIFNF